MQDFVAKDYFLPCPHVKLYVTGLENVFYSPQDQTVKEGKGVFFQCVSGDSSPPADITWLKDGTLVQRGRQIKVHVYSASYRKKHT